MIELRWLKVVSAEWNEARRDYVERLSPSVLQYRTMEAVNSSIANRGYIAAEWTSWKNVPEVFMDEK